VFCCAYIVDDSGTALSDELQTTNLLQAYCIVSNDDHAGKHEIHLLSVVPLQAQAGGNLCLYSVIIRLEAHCVHAKSI
jgi:hypothetical protein